MEYKGRVSTSSQWRISFGLDIKQSVKWSVPRPAGERKNEEVEENAKVQIKRK